MIRLRVLIRPRILSDKLRGVVKFRHRILIAIKALGALDVVHQRHVAYQVHQSGEVCDARSYFTECTFERLTT